MGPENSSHTFRTSFGGIIFVSLRKTKYSFPERRRADTAFVAFPKSVGKSPVTLGSREPA